MKILNETLMIQCCDLALAAGSLLGCVQLIQRNPKTLSLIYSSPVILHASGLLVAF